VCPPPHTPPRAGVKPAAKFGTNNTWWPRLTVRDVLTQQTGLGKLPPGTAWMRAAEPFCCVSFRPYSDSHINENGVRLNASTALA
jgi:hypothetical protein